MRRMSMRSGFFGLALVCVAAFAFPASAHHSHGNYAMDDFTVMEGTITEVLRINPHSWVSLEVMDESGESRVWLLEATGPAGLERNGIKQEDVVAGDTVSVRCHKLRDGSPGCLLGFLTPMHGDAARGHGVEIEWD
jgi:hypothetical protein